MGPLNGEPQLLRLGHGLFAFRPFEANHNQRVRLDPVGHRAGLRELEDLRIGELHGVGPFDRVFREITVCSHFMDFDGCLPGPVPDLDAGLDGLVRVLIQQGDVEPVVAHRSAMGHAIERKFRVELQPCVLPPKRFGVVSSAPITPSTSAMNRSKSYGEFDESLLDELAPDVAATHADGLLNS